MKGYLNRNKGIFWVLLFGVVWGLVEGSLGWFVHLFHLRVFTPLLVITGIGCMSLAVVKTNTSLSALKVGLIAALLKSMNVLLLTYEPLSWVFSPVVHILLESVAVTFIFYLLREVGFGISRIPGIVPVREKQRND